MTDVEIRIARRSGGTGIYSLELLVDRVTTWSGGLDPSRLSSESADRPFREALDVLQWQSDLADRIYRWLFSDPGLETAWADLRAHYPNRRVRITVDNDVLELHVVPWELLREPAAGAGFRYLAADNESAFSRFLQTSHPLGTPILERPIRVLVAIADPAGPEDNRRWNLAPIPVDAELELIRRATHGLPVDVQELPRPWTLADLERALLRGYHVLHFVGHGAISQDGRDGALLLNGGRGRIDPVPADRLAGMMERVLPAGGPDGASLRLVFLMSCETAHASTGGAFAAWHRRSSQQACRRSWPCRTGSRWKLPTRSPARSTNAC
jgi:hypothetical protein